MPSPQIVAIRCLVLRRKAARQPVQWARPIKRRGSPSARGRSGYGRRHVRPASPRVWEGRQPPVAGGPDRRRDQPARSATGQGLSARSRNLRRTGRRVHAPFGCCDGLTCATSAINTSYGICVPGEGGMISTGTGLISPFSGTAVEEVAALVEAVSDSPRPISKPNGKRASRRSGTARTPMTPSARRDWTPNALSGRHDVTPNAPKAEQADPQ